MPHIPYNLLQKAAPYCKTLPQIRKIQKHLHTGIRLKKGAAACLPKAIVFISINQIRQYLFTGPYPADAFLISAVE